MSKQAATPEAHNPTPLPTYQRPPTSSRADSGPRQGTFPPPDLADAHPRPSRSLHAPVQKRDDEMHGERATQPATLPGRTVAPASDKLGCPAANAEPACVMEERSERVDVQE